MNTKFTVENAKTSGRKGGAKTAFIHGPEFYAEIGRKGGLAKAAKKKAVLEA